MIVVNLFAGPGAGKSTTAAGLFKLLKRAYYNVEQVTEYAKDLVWDERHKMFGEQEYIFAKQNQRLRRLVGKVDIAVTDSPIILGHAYMPKDYYLPSLHRVLDEAFSSYTNINYLLERKKDYVQIGRNQTAEEAKAIDTHVQSILWARELKYEVIAGDEQAEFNILNDLVPKLQAHGIWSVKEKQNMEETKRILDSLPKNPGCAGDPVDTFGGSDY